MSEYGAWHYKLQNGTAGTIAGEGLGPREEAIAELRTTYGKRADGMELRKAGEDYEKREVR